MRERERRRERERERERQREREKSAHTIISKVNMYFKINVCTIFYFTVGHPLHTSYVYVTWPTSYQHTNPSSSAAMEVH